MHIQRLFMCFVAVRKYDSEISGPKKIAKQINYLQSLSSQKSFVISCSHRRCSIEQGLLINFTKLKTCAMNNFLSTFNLGGFSNGNDMISKIFFSLNFTKMISVISEICYCTFYIKWRTYQTQSCLLVCIFCIFYLLLRGLCLKELYF